jgi:hypothetical protein
MILNEIATFFTIPKAFEGTVGIAQQNAISSWKKMANVIVFGDDAGVAEFAEKLSVDHVGEIEKNENGTPLVNSAFDAARDLATTPYLIYCNSDIILFDDFETAIRQLIELTYHDPFVAMGRRTTFAVDALIDFQDATRVADLRKNALDLGEPDSIVCKEFFVFPREMYQEMPSFAVGRGNWDNWVIHNAKTNQIPVISLSKQVLTLHQQHDHGHVKNRYTAYVCGAEAKRNQELANGRHLISGSTPDFYLENDSLLPARMKYVGGAFWADFPRFIYLLMNFVGMR